MDEFEALVSKKFPNQKIVKLKDLTYKIASVSKVRYGNNRTETNYHEISLNYIDPMGLIYVPDSNYKIPAPANPKALLNQTLMQGDLIILNRGKVGKMGIIGAGYRNRLIGNTSMIRIQFDDNRRKDTPFFVMQYLQLDYIKDFIDTFITTSSSDRKILSAEVLSNIPIPYFEEKEGEYQNLLFNRKLLTFHANQGIKEMEKMVDFYKHLENNTIDAGITADKEKLISLKLSVAEEFDKLRSLQDELKRLLSDSYEKYSLLN